MPPVSTLSAGLAHLPAHSGETRGSQRRIDASVIVVSFNTRTMLRNCLNSLFAGAAGLTLDVIVVDNASQDGSAAMVAVEFPGVRLLPSPVNLGFAAANNLGFAVARGSYLVLLNSDAFLASGALARAITHMEAESDVALGGARLTGTDGAWQPAARQFPSLWNDFLALSGLAHRYRQSRFWGRADRTWADPLEAADTDWVPGAFSIVRADALRVVGGFDESFFLYYEEVDLCRRMRAAGYRVRYWPDVTAVHIGGASSESLAGVVRSRTGSQLTLWRMRSAFLYYRKHHGRAVWPAFGIEWSWHALRALRNATHGARDKAQESRTVMALLRQAWRETARGRQSPQRPW